MIGDAVIPCISIKIGHEEHIGLLDSGAAYSYVREDLVSRSSRVPAESRSVQTADSQIVRVDAVVTVKHRIGARVIDWTLWVLPSCVFPVILGCDFLRDHHVNFDFANNRACIDGDVVPFTPPTERSAFCAILDCALPADLTASQRANLLRVVLPQYMSTAETPYGRVTIVEHAIDTGSSRPVHQSPRPLSPGERDKVKAIIADLIDKKVIRPSQSPWASPIVMVPKKDGSVRLCIDFRRVNTVTVKDAFPLPRVEDLLEATRGKKWYTTLDAASGYWQIAMEKSSIAKTAFTCCEGLFEWVVMPFGLCNAPATFQRAMQEILGPYLWRNVLVYIDDIIVYSESFEAHLQDVDTILRRLYAHGILLQLKKCRFACQSVEFLGHVVSRQGIQADPSKLEKLRAFPTPTNVAELRTFLGFASYYRKFIRNLATIASPLYRLTQTGAVWEWDADSVAAFTKIKTAIADNATLDYSST